MRHYFPKYLAEYADYRPTAGELDKLREQSELALLSVPDQAREYLKLSQELLFDGSNHEDISEKWIAFYDRSPWSYEPEITTLFAIERATREVSPDPVSLKWGDGLRKYTTAHFAVHDVATYFRRIVTKVRLDLSAELDPIVLDLELGSIPSMDAWEWSTRLATECSISKPIAPIAGPRSVTELPKESDRFIVLTLRDLASKDDNWFTASQIEKAANDAGRPLGTSTCARGLGQLYTAEGWVQKSENGRGFRPIV